MKQMKSKWMTKMMAVLMVLQLSVMAATAENYPYRSDYLWLTVPDHADWL